MSKTYVLVGFVIVFLLLTAAVIYVVKNRSDMKNTYTSEGSSLVTPEVDVVIPTTISDAIASPVVTQVSSTTAAMSKDTPAPTVDEISLVITSPKNGITVSTPSITITGKTAPKAEVFINDADTIADTTGAFSVNLTLEEGENMIVIIANAADGQFAEQEMTITYTSEN